VPPTPEEPGDLVEGLEGPTGTTVNRYRDLLSAMFKRAVRLGLVPVNPVKEIPKFREAGAPWPSCPRRRRPRSGTRSRSELRPAFVVALHTGLRWGEQASLRWRLQAAVEHLVAAPPAAPGRMEVGLELDSAGAGQVSETAKRR
jgi:hypothetical protein